MTFLSPSKEVKKRISFPFYLLIYSLCSIIGFLEGGVLGLIGGLTSSLVSSLLVLCGLIPFAGIPLYFILSSKLHSLITTFSTSIPLAQTFALILFGLLAIFINIILSAIVLLLIIKAVQDLLR